MLTFAEEQEVAHVVAEGDVHVAAVELAGQAAAVEGGDGVGAVRGRGEASPSPAGKHERITRDPDRTPTCTSAAVWGRPPCSGSSWENIQALASQKQSFSSA